MKHIQESHFILILLVIVLPLKIFSQNNTSSPYSFFGYGDMSNIAYGKNLSMGGTGFAIRDKNQMNLKNPAALTSIDSLTVLFELGFFLKNSEHKTTTNNNNLYDGNLTHVAIGHRINSRLMTSYGIMPFSEIGYNFVTIDNVQGETTPLYNEWQGSGGIAKYFFALGGKVSNHLSLGVEASLLYGPITKTINTTVSTLPTNTSVLVMNTNYIGFNYKGAFQYTQPIGTEGSEFTLGGTFSPKQIFAGITSVDISQYHGATETTIYSKEGNYKAYNVPMSYGGGLGFTYKNKYFITADYEAQPWGDENSGEYLNRNIYSVGAELMPQNNLNYFKRCSYRVGMRYDGGYFNVNNFTIDDMRFSLGIGMPIQKSRSTLNITFEAGQRGTQNAGMVRERYGKLTFAFSFHDYWFKKQKLE